MVKKITPGPDTDAVAHPVETKAILAHMMMLALEPVEPDGARLPFLTALGSAVSAHVDPAVRAVIWSDVQAVCRRAALVASGPGPMDRVQRPEVWYDAPERTENELTVAYSHAIEACNFTR
jgi:hypothetical protein